MKERLGKVKLDFWFFTKFFVITGMVLFIVYPFYTILTKSVFSNKVEGLTLEGVAKRLKGDRKDVIGKARVLESLKAIRQQLAQTREELS